MKEVYTNGTKSSEGVTLLRNNFTVTLLFTILANSTVNGSEKYSIWMALKTHNEPVQLLSIVFMGILHLSADI